MRFTAARIVVARFQTTPAEGIDGLIEIVEDLVDDGAIQPSWLGQLWLALLHTVEWALEIGFDSLAVGLLEAFVGQAEGAIALGSVTAEDGAQLIDSAQALIASIQG